jgi:hypothetical protein
MGCCRKAKAMQQAPGARFGIIAIERLKQMMGLGYRLPILTGAGIGLGLDRRENRRIAANDKVQRRVGQ